MRDEEIERLLAEALESGGGPEENPQLAVLLSANPEARRRYDEALAAHRALESVPQEAMPEGLDHEIRMAIRSGRRGEHRWHAVLQAWRATIRRRPLAGLAPAFVTGAAAGALIVGLLAPHVGPPRGLQTQGTLQPLGGEAASQFMDSAAVGGTKVGAWRFDSHLILNMAIGADVENRIDLSFDGATLEFDSIRWTKGEEGRVEAGPGMASLVSGGPAACELTFRVKKEPAGDVHLAQVGPGGSGTVSLRTGPWCSGCSGVGSSTGF